MNPTRKLWLRCALAALLFLSSAPAWPLAQTQAGQAKTLKRPDGTVLTYEVFGEQGKKLDTLLMVHCWACNRHYWDKITGGLAEDYLVVTLDLPGHGDSPTPRKDWTYAAMGEEIAAVARELGLKKFIVVGHSMGGPLALQVAAMMPGQVEGVVCVDTLHNVEFDFKKQGFNLTEQNFQQVMADFLPQMIHPKSDPAWGTWLIDQVQRADRKVALSLWDQFNVANYGAMMAAAKVPIRCVNAKKYNDISQKTEVAINRKYGDFDVIELKDVGHFPMLERPAGLLRKLKKAILQVEAAASKS